MTNFFAKRALEHFEKKRFKNANEDYTKAISIEPNNHILYNMRGMTYRYLGKESNALQDYNKAIQLFSKNSKIFYNRGILKLYDFKQYNSAIKDFDKAIELDNQDPSFFEERAKAKEALKNFNDANIDYLKAEQLIQKKLKQKEYEKEGQKRIEEEEKKLQQINLETVSSLKITSMNQVKKVLKISEKGIAFFNQKN